jgi:hypothetical protein
MTDIQIRFQQQQSAPQQSQSQKGQKFLGKNSLEIRGGGMVTSSSSSSNNNSNSNRNNNQEAESSGLSPQPPISKTNNKTKINKDKQASTVGGSVGVANILYPIKMSAEINGTATLVASVNFIKSSTSKAATNNVLGLNLPIDTNLNNSQQQINNNNNNISQMSSSRSSNETLKKFSLLQNNSQQQNIHNNHNNNINNQIINASTSRSNSSSLISFQDNSFSKKNGNHNYHVNSNSNQNNQNNNNNNSMWNDESNSVWTGTGVMSDRSSVYSIDDGVSF